MALQIITLAGMKARSSLAEVQALTDETLEPLEADALDLLEAELGRRLTVDTNDVAVTLPGSGMTILPLPEALVSITSVVSVGLGDITTGVETIAGGWLLHGIEPLRYHFRSALTITGKWGLDCPDKMGRVIMDVVEALAVRRADPITHRDELSPWGSLTDGGLRADRDSAHRKATLENLLRYDVKKRLSGFYCPARLVEVV